MKTYTVTAKRWAHGWELHIDDVGVTQTRSLSAAEATAREYIAFALDIEDEDPIAIDVVPQLDVELTKQIRAARERVEAAGKMQREAAAKQRQVANRLRQTGLSGREIAAVLDITPQRVSQLIGKASTSASGRRDTQRSAASGRSAVEPHNGKRAVAKAKAGTRTATARVAGRRRARTKG